jgi:hypothetical protein
VCSCSTNRTNPAGTAWLGTHGGGGEAWGGGAPHGHPQPTHAARSARAGGLSSMSAILSFVHSLRSEAVGEAFDSCLETISTILNNVLEFPTEEKFRKVRLANATFHKRVGQFPSGLALLRELGFEDAFGEVEPGGDTLPTHLALPVADAALLAHGLVVSVHASAAHSHTAHARTRTPMPYVTTLES